MNVHREAVRARGFSLPASLEKRFRFGKRLSFLYNNAILSFFRVL
jgi:hypothetical protein